MMCHTIDMKLKNLFCWRNPVELFVGRMAPSQRFVYLVIASNIFQMHSAHLLTRIYCISQPQPCEMALFSIFHSLFTPSGMNCLVIFINHLYDSSNAWKMFTTLLTLVSAIRLQTPNIPDFKCIHCWIPTVSSLPSALFSSALDTICNHCHFRWNV